MELFTELAPDACHATGVFMGHAELSCQKPPLLDGFMLGTDRGLQDGDLNHEVFHLVLKRSLVRHQNGSSSAMRAKIAATGSPFFSASMNCDASCFVN